MRETAQSCGRDPESLELSFGHLVPAVTPDKAERLAALGADRLVLAASPLPDLAAARDELSACADRLGLT
jgi:hypothetical protein